jgi:ketosteroid isomerase-like protein
MTATTTQETRQLIQRFVQAHEHGDTCRDGRIADVRNYTDTLHADRVFGLDNKTPTTAP